MPQTTEPTCHNYRACVPQLEREKTRMPQLERSCHATTKDPECLNKDPACHNEDTMKTQRSQKKKRNSPVAPVSLRSKPSPYNSLGGPVHPAHTSLTSAPTAPPFFTSLMSVSETPGPLQRTSLSQVTNHQAHSLLHLWAFTPRLPSQHGFPSPPRIN